MFLAWISIRPALVDFLIIDTLIYKKIKILVCEDRSKKIYFLMLKKKVFSINITLKVGFSIIDLIWDVKLNWIGIKLELNQSGASLV